ncbi:transglycosylase SLT domain-containing protein [Brucella sp. C7-11G]
MARLPSVSTNPVITQGPQSTLSAAQIANPYLQIADAFGSIGTKLEEHNVNQAEQDGANAVYRDEAGTLHVNRREGISRSAEAYNRAANQSYTARLAGDIRAKGTTLMQEAQGDVDAFNTSWKGFTDQLLANAPKEARGAIETMLDTNGSQFGLGVSEQKRKRDLTVFENDIKTEIQFLDNDMAALARSGGTGTTAYLEKQSQLKSLYGELVANPEFTVSEKQAAMEMQRVESRHMSEAIVGSIDKTLSTGGVKAAQKEAERILTDEKLHLSPAERRQYAGLAEQRITGFVAEQKVALKPVQDQASKFKKLFDEGVGLDNPDVDATIATLAKGGDMAGALDLINSRRAAQTIQQFNLSSPDARVGALERGRAAANGINLTGGNLVDRVIGAESSWNPDAVSKKGASGLMQVMPETGVEIAGELGDANYPVDGTEAEQQAYLKRADVSKRYGTHYLKKQLARYNGDEEAALIAYNGGATRADAWLAAGRDDSVIPRESADYYKKVLGKSGNFQSTGRTFAQSGPSEARAFLLSRSNKDASHIDGMDAGFGNKLAALIQAAPPGISEKLGIYSGARSVERQTELWDAALKKYGSVAEARKWVAPPPGVAGSKGSNHNHGTAADLSYNGQSLKNAPPEVVDWLHSHAKDFGLKFPLSNENWHIEDDSTRGGAPNTSRPTMDPEVIKAYRSGVTADAKSLWGDMKDGISKGIPPAANEMSLLTRQLSVIDDPQFRREVTSYLSSEDAASMFATMPPQQATALLDELKVDAGDGATIAQQQIMETAERTAKRVAEAMQNDPIGYGAQRQWTPSVPAIDLAAGPDAVGSAFKARQTSIDLLQARGMIQPGTSALRPQDKAVLNQVLTQGTPGEQAQLFGAMSKNLDPKTYMATMGALAGDANSRTAASAGALYQYNPQVAEGVLRGQALLKENPNFAPKKTDDNQTLIDEILPPQAFGAGLEGSRQMLLDSARARYADLSNSVGDTSGEFNQERMTQSINEVTGGMIDFNGQNIMAPKYGMSQQDFDSVITNLSDEALSGAITSEGQQITASDLRRYGRLRAVSDGRYLLEFGLEDAPTFAMSKPVMADSRVSRAGRGAFVLDLRGDQ